MYGDRLVEGFRRAVRRVRSDDTEVDYGAFYPATVVKQDGNTLDVIFDDRERLGFKSGIDIRPPIPGQTLKFAKDTRVLVAWWAGDERYPYVSGVWLGNGGLVDLTHVFSGTYTLDGPSYRGHHTTGTEFDTPTVHVKGDVKYEHDIGRGIPPQATTLSNDVVVVATLGAPHMFIVQLTVKNAIAGNVPLFAVAFPDVMPGQVPMAVGNICNSLGLFGSPLGILATQALLTCVLGYIGTPIPPGPYVATIHTSSWTPL